MKHYTGKKSILAKPMTYGEAHKNGLIPNNTYIKENDECHGYIVEYADGYRSWSPAGVFEESYKIAETILDRINIEYEDIMERVNKLSDFIFNKNDGKDYQSLPLSIRAMLLGQLHAMSSYTNLLNLRKSCIENNVDCHCSGLSFEQILPMLREGFAIRREGWNGKGLMVFKQVPSHITDNTIPKMQSLPEEAKRLILATKGHIDYANQCLIYNPETGRADSWVPSISDVFANDWKLVE